MVLTQTRYNPLPAARGVGARWTPQERTLVRSCRKHGQLPKAIVVQVQVSL